MCTAFCWESPKEREPSEDQGVSGKLDQNESYEDWLVGVDWTRLSQDRDR
jgi:hypothetical protein